MSTLLLVRPASEAAADAGAWLEVRSPHFVVVSNAGAARARQVAAELERARALVQHLARQMLWPVFAPTRLDPRQPVWIVAVKDAKGLRELVPQLWERRGPRAVGASWPGPHHHHVVVQVDGSDEDRRQRLLHEYAHVLVSASLPEAPAWLDEGLAELWSDLAIREDDDAVEVGRPVLKHVGTLRASAWIPPDEILATERGRHTRGAHAPALFYAQAWALTHSLVIGDGTIRPRLALRDYLSHLRYGVNALEAARLAFGDLSAFEQTLRAYVRAGTFRSLRMRAALPETGASGVQPPAVRPVPAAEALAVRGTFLAYGERPASARPVLTQALDLDATQQLALESLGYVHFQQNDLTEASRWFARAIESGSGSSLAHYYFAILARGREDGGSPGSIEEAHLRRAIALDPSFAPAYARLGDAIVRRVQEEVLGGKEVQKVQEVQGVQARLVEAVALTRRATELEPDNSGYWIDLGRLMLALNRPHDAREAAERGLAAARSARARELAFSFLREIATRYPRP